MRVSRFWLNNGSDVTNPILTLPTGIETGGTTADGTVVVTLTSAQSAVGTLYYIASTFAVLSNADIIAGSSQATTAEGSQAISFTDLFGSTVYYAHYLYLDSQGQYSNQVVSSSFTTEAKFLPQFANHRSAIFGAGIR